MVIKGSRKSCKKNARLFFSVIFAGILCCLYLPSCSKNSSTNSSAVTYLDQADGFIRLGQTQDALKLLQKIEKITSDSNIRIGVYRRYLALGEDKRAEDILVACSKKDPDNLKIAALYASFLLKKQRYEQARTVSKKLSGTKYSSIYSEVVLRQAVKDFKNVRFDDFCTSDYYKIYFDAWNGTGDNMWLRNCAVIHLYRGEYTDAQKLHPQELQNATDALFWASVMYDCRQFVTAAQDLLFAKEEIDRELADIFEQKKYLDLKQNLKLKIYALLADCYVCLSEEKEAENIRNSILAVRTEDAGTSANMDFSDKILSVLYVNSAMWSFSQKDMNAAYKLLSFAVEKWPDFVPGLIAYGNYSRVVNQLQMNDPLTLELRKAGVRSMDMKAFDDIPRIPLTDPIDRMKKSLERIKNYDLYVAMLDLEDSLEPEIQDKVRLARMWNVLERNSTGPNNYPSQIARYAVHTLLLCGQEKEARFLFDKYLNSHYSFDTSVSFSDSFFQKIHDMMLWEVEYAAYFALLDKNRALTQSLYEYIVLNEHSANGSTVSELSPLSSYSAVMNLAMIYSSSNNKKQALNLYSKLIGRTQDTKEKAEILFRLGVIQKALEQDADALKSLKYCLYLNPGHVKANNLLLEMTR